MSAPAALHPVRSQVPPPVGEKPRPVQRVSVQEGYKLWAATYDGDPNPLLALEERELVPRLTGLRGKNVLDAGCGTGRWLRRLVSSGARTVTGVDSSAAMLEQASGRLLNCHAGLRRTGQVAPCLVRADCLALPIRSRSADLILCSFAIGHIRSLRALAGELSRVARPGADVVLTDLHPQAQSRGWRVGFRCEGAAIEIEACLHAQEEIRQAFESCGFRLMERHDLKIGEPERPIFARAGKERMFEEACALPAVLFCRFQAGLIRG